MGLIIIASVLAELFWGFTSNSASTVSTPKRTLPIIISPSLPDKLVFVSENVPLNEFDVIESLDRELISNTFFHSQTISFIKKATRFLPEVEKILQEEGVPDDFKYLPFIESAYSNVVSPAGAAGYWQFLKGTASDYGLEVNKYIDERYHFSKATHAACEFLKESYEEFGSWTLAAASYNMGRRRLREAIEEQGVNSYYNLYLNEETSRYVFRLLAVKLILEEPRLYGFAIDKGEKYPPIPTRSITINQTEVDWFEFAKQQGVSYKTLKQLNPWLVNNHLVNSNRKSYTIDLPEKP